MAIKRINAGARMSSAVVHGNTVYLAGLTADDTKADVKGQTAQILAKIDKFLADAGTDGIDIRAGVIQRHGAVAPGGVGNCDIAHPHRIARQSGAHLVEVGTTNRTYVADYDAALTHESAGFLRVHSSNFRVIGFTHEAGLGELAALAAKRGVLLLDDLGSGALLDTAAYGLAREPLVQESVAAGADLVFFSGDKLLGGPQAGIIVGKRAQVDRLKRHPLARAVRIDKLSLAALAIPLLALALPDGRAVALKIDDGADRAATALTLALLDSLGVDIDPVRHLNKPIRGWGQPVGEVRAVLN